MTSPSVRLFTYCTECLRNGNHTFLPGCRFNSLGSESTFRHDLKE